MEALRVNIISTDNTRNKEILFYVMYIIFQAISGYFLFSHIEPKLLHNKKGKWFLYALYISIFFGFVKIFFTNMFYHILSFVNLSISDISFIFVYFCVYVMVYIFIVSLSDEVFKKIQDKTSDLGDGEYSIYVYYLILIFIVFFISLADGLIGLFIKIIYGKKASDLDIFYSTSNGIECMSFNQQKHTSCVNMYLIFEVDLETLNISLLNKNIRGESGFRGGNYRIITYSDHDYTQYKDKTLIFANISVDFYNPKKSNIHNINFIHCGYKYKGEEFIISDVVNSDPKWAVGNLARCAHYINKALIEIYEKYDIKPTDEVK